MDNVLLFISLAVYAYVFLIVWLSAFWAMDELTENLVKVIASFIFAVIWPVTVPALFFSKVYRK